MFSIQRIWWVWREKNWWSWIHCGDILLLSDEMEGRSFGSKWRDIKQTKKTFTSKLKYQYIYIGSAPWWWESGYIIYSHGVINNFFMSYKCCTRCYKPKKWKDFFDIKGFTRFIHCNTSSFHKISFNDIKLSFYILHYIHAWEKQWMINIISYQCITIYELQASILVQVNLK